MSERIELSVVCEGRSESAVEKASGRGTLSIRPVVGDAELASFAVARRRACRRAGSPSNEAPFDAVRRFATTIGAFEGRRIVGGVSAWRLSESFCSLGHLLAGVGIERYSARDVVEVGGLFVAASHRGTRVSHRLLDAVRVLLAGMAPELIVAFAVESEARRYERDWGFRRVGPPARHPFAAAVRVVPMVARLPEIIEAGRATVGGELSVGDFGVGGAMPDENERSGVRR